MPENITDKLKQASGHMAAGRFDVAADLYISILQQDENCLEAINNMVKISYHKQDLNKVELYVRRSLELKDDNFPFTLLLGGIYFQLGKLTDAVDTHRKAIDIDPTQKLFVLDQLGRGLLAHQKINESLSIFKEEAAARKSAIDVVLLNNCKLDAERAAAGNPYYKKLKNVVIEGDYWLILDDDCVYANEITGRNPLNSRLIRGRATQDSKTIVIDVIKPTVSISEPVIFIGGDNNYSHWLLRYISRIAIFEAELDLNEYKFLVTSELAPYQKESLELIGISEDRLVRIPPEQFTECKEVVVSTQLRTEAHIGIAAAWIRDNYCSPTLDKNTANRRLYISRRDATMRKLLNEEELISALLQKGFEVVTPGELSFSEQISLFGEAGIIVGPHGAGLTNIVFAPAGCIVVELADKLCEHMPEFRWLAKSIGQKCISMVSQDVEVLSDTTQSQQEHSFRVNVQEIMELLDKNIEAIKK